MLIKLVQLSLVAGLLLGVLSEEEVGDGEGNYKIEGKLTPPDVKSLNWISDVSIILDGGKRRTFLNEDNSFSIQVCTAGRAQYMYLVRDTVYSLQFEL